MKNIFFIILFFVTSLFSADDISFTQKVQFEQQKYNDIKRGKKSLASELKSTLPPEAFKKNGKLKADHPAVIKVRKAYKQRSEIIGLEAQNKYNQALETVGKDSHSGVNALRSELKEKKKKIFDKYEARLKKNPDGSFNRDHPSFKKIKAQMNTELDKTHREMNLRDASRKEYIQKTFGDAKLEYDIKNGKKGLKSPTIKANVEFVGSPPNDIKSDLDMNSRNDKEFKKIIKNDKSWVEYSDRFVNTKHDITTWKKNSLGKGIKGKVGQSSHDSEMVFGAQKNSDSFPTTDGKRYASGAKNYNKANAITSNQIKYVHSYGDKTPSNINIDNIDSIDTKTMAKSTYKSMEIAEVSVDGKFKKQLKDLKDGKSVEEALDLFGHSKNEKNKRVKELLVNSKNTMAESYDKASTENTKNLNNLEDKRQKLIKEKASTKEIKKVEKKLYKEKLFLQENKAVLGELATINPKVTGDMVSKEVDVIRKTDGSYYSVDKKRNMSSSEIKEHITGDMNTKTAKKSQFVDVSSSYFSKGKKKIVALNSSKSVKGLKVGIGYLDLALGTVKAAEQAVMEEKEGDSYLKTYLKTLYYTTPVKGLTDLQKSSTFSALDNYKKAMKASGKENDTFTQAKNLAKHGSIALFNMGYTFIKGTVTGFYDTGADTGKYLEKATRTENEEKSLHDKDVMEQRLASYNTNKLGFLYDEASSLDLNNKKAKEDFNNKLNRYIKQWNKREDASMFSQRAISLKNALNKTSVEVVVKEKKKDDNPFAADMSNDLFADVDQNKVNDVKRQLENNKQREKAYTASKISSKVSSLSDESRRKWAARAAAAAEMQQTLQQVSQQMNDIRAKERAQDKRYAEVAAQNKTNLYNSQRKQYDYNTQPKKSASGYQIIDPYAQRYASSLQKKTTKPKPKSKPKPVFVAPKPKPKPKPVFVAPKPKPKPKPVYVAPKKCSDYTLMIWQSGGTALAPSDLCAKKMNQNYKNSIVICGKTIYGGDDILLINLQKFSGFYVLKDKNKKTICEEDR
ncbi:hypothetical protein [Sulfurimonas sp.]|uniref:hypothetical protein n=1 Tax=Sulfurimonas sp. TaxID=2022749 RepID=UPI002AB24E25|nr:hypothetical protein [Sulfurimonas sp.]